MAEKKSFGEALRTFRVAAGMTQKQLADAVGGIRQQNVGEVEKGKRSGFARDTVERIERVLGLKAGELARHLPKGHAARELAETEVPDMGIVWGSPPRHVPDPVDGATFKLTGRWPAGTFVLRVSGHSVHRYGVHDGDVIAVEPSEEQVSGALLIARQGNAYTIKGCWDGKLWSFSRDDETPKEMDSREPYQIIGRMIGIVDGQRGFLPIPRIKPAPKKK